MSATALRCPGLSPAPCARRNHVFRSAVVTKASAQESANTDASFSRCRPIPQPVPALLQEAASFYQMRCVQATCFGSIGGLPAEQQPSEDAQSGGGDAATAATSRQLS